MTAKQCTCNPSFETQTRFVGSRSVKTTGSTMVRSTDPELQQPPQPWRAGYFRQRQPPNPQVAVGFHGNYPLLPTRGEAGAASRTSRAPRTDRRPTPDRRTPPTAPHPQPHHPFPALGIRESEKFFILP